MSLATKSRSANRQTARSQSALVTELYRIRQERKQLEERDREISDYLVAKGPGELKGEDGIVAQVRFPAPKIVTPTADKADFLLRKLGDAKFNKLFEPVWKPIKEFRAVVRAICTPAEQRAAREALEVESKPYVCFP